MCLPFDDLAQRTLGKGEHLGFEWEIVSNHHGYRCGYVRVLPGHPWFGKGYDEIEAQVHGGLTFGENGRACPTHGPEAEWWVGFDCGHAWDAPDPELLKLPFVRALPYTPFHRDEVVRDQEYVEAECRSLCEQAAAASG